MHTPVTTSAEHMPSLSAFPRAARTCGAVSTVVLRYSLILLLLGGGLGKFTQEKAKRLTLLAGLQHQPHQEQQRRNALYSRPAEQSGYRNVNQHVGRHNSHNRT